MGRVIRGALLILAGLLPALSPVAAGAADPWPTQPIRWLVPYPAGGGTDVLARQLANVMKDALGQQLVIDNRPGASTNIAAEAVARAKPDGYMVMSADNAALSFNEHLFKTLPYKPAEDFTYIHTIGRFPLVLVANPNANIKTVAQLLDRARAEPGKISYGSPGNGSPHHVGTELLKQAAGVNLLHVPYRGQAPAVQDLLGGEIQVMFLDLFAGMPLIKDGRVVPIAVGSAQRMTALPDVPSFVESGLAGVEVFAFQGLLGPGGMPADIADKLANAVAAALADAGTAPRLRELGLEPMTLRGDAFKRFARGESDRWGPVIKRAGITLD